MPIVQAAIIRAVSVVGDTPRDLKNDDLSSGEPWIDPSS
jgi:hypothetical protein